MNKMRIAFFASGVPWLKPSGGREQRVWDIAKHLAKNHKVEFICPDFSDQIKGFWKGSFFNQLHHTYVKTDVKDNVFIRYTPSFKTPWRHISLFLAKLYFLHYAHKYADVASADILYCSRAPFHVLRPLPKKIADLGRLWIWHWSPITLIDNFSNLLGFEYADKCIFNAEKNRAVANHMVLDKRARDNFLVINPGIDLKRFNPTKSKKIYDCLFVGRGEKAKGIKDFIKLAKLMPDKRFCIAGDYKGRYPNNVVCLGHIDMPKVYNQSRFLIQTSYGESYSQTVLEALACGLHIISYNTIATEFYPYCEIVKKGNYNAMMWKIIHSWNKKKIVPREWLKQFDKGAYLKNIENAVCKD